MIARALRRFVARKPWSAVLALTGITLGVVSIVSVHLISASISNQLDRLVPGQLAGFTHFLHRDSLAANDYFELRRGWRRGELPGVRSLAPLIDETTEIKGRAVRVIGVDLLNPDQVIRDASEGDGSGFAWNGVWVDESLKAQLDVPVNGIIDAPDGTLMADIGPAQMLLAWPSDRLSYLGVRVDDPFSELLRRLEFLLPGFGAGFPSTNPDLQLSSDWQLVSMAEQYPAREFGKSVLFNISALGLLALLVAWLLIYQVSVSWLRQLWPIFERLHVLGVDWTELRALFLAGMALLAALASVFGILLGLGLAQWLLDEAMPINGSRLQLDANVIVKGAGSAFAVCLVGGAMAFQQARRPLDYGLASLLVVVPAICVALYCLADEATGLAGGFVGIAVLALASGFLVAPLLKRLRALSQFIRGPYLARLGIREAIWYPQDVSVALAGLTLAIGTAIGVGLMVDSFRADFDAMLEQRLDYDLIAEGDHAALGRLETVVSGHPLVARSQSYRDGQVRIQGVPAELRVARVDQLEAQRYGDFPALTPGQALVSEQAARALGVDAGSRISMPWGTIEVVGVFSGFGDVQPRLIVDERSPLAQTAGPVNSIGIMTDAPDRLLALLDREFSGLRFRLQTDIRSTALETFDQTFAITRVLIAIALLVATLSVYIAITSLRLNRPTADRLLTTLGVTRAERFGMDFALGLGFGSIALLLALPLGMAFGWILCDVVNPRAFGWSIDLQLVPDSFLQPMLLGLGAAVFACLLRVGQKEGGTHGAR